MFLCIMCSYGVYKQKLWQIYLIKLQILPRCMFKSYESSHFGANFEVMSYMFSHIANV